MKREPNTEYILSLSYGKDSMACLGAIEQQGWPLDRIVTVEVWATDTIPADLPPMVEFKERADAIIKERWGIEVEHIAAMKSQRERERERERLTSPCSTMCFQEESTLGTSKDFLLLEELGVSISNTDQKLTYQDIFYRPIQTREDKRIYGFPMRRTPWCMGSLKRDPIGKMLHNMRGGVALNAYNILVLLLMNPKDLLALIK